MPTQVKTAVEVKVSVKLTNEVKLMIQAGRKFEGATISTVEMLRAESLRMGIDEDGSRQLLFLSFETANLDAKATAEERKEYRNTVRFEVSRLMQMAFPPAEVKADVDAAIEHDKALNGAKHGRIGVNRTLAIARKQITFNQAKAGEKVTKTNGSNATPKVLDLSQDALDNALAGIRSTFAKATAEHKAAFTPKQLRDRAAVVFCNGAYTPSKK